MKLIHRTPMYIVEEKSAFVIGGALEPHNKRDSKFKHPQKNLKGKLKG